MIFEKKSHILQQYDVIQQNGQSFGQLPWFQNAFSKLPGFRNSYDQQNDNGRTRNFGLRISYNYGRCRCWYKIFWKKIEDNCIKGGRPVTWFKAFHGCMCECVRPRQCPHPPYTCGCEISPGTIYVCNSLGIGTG